MSYAPAGLRSGVASPAPLMQPSYGLPRVAPLWRAKSGLIQTPQRHLKSTDRTPAQYVECSAGIIHSNCSRDGSLLILYSSIRALIPEPAAACFLGFPRSSSARDVIVCRSLGYQALSRSASFFRGIALPKTSRFCDQAAHLALAADHSIILILVCPGSSAN